MGIEATWLSHSAPIQFSCEGAGEDGKCVGWNSILYMAGVEAIGTSYFIFTLFHIFTGIQGARMKELAPALSSCIKKHQCPGLDTHCYKKCRGVQSLIVTD